MADYYIEKSRCTISVKTHSGDVLSGDMFLQPYGRYGGGVERPIDILNANDLFFPVVRTNGETVLISKDNVLFVTCDSDRDEEGVRKTLARNVGVEVVLCTGDVVKATAFLEVPEDHSRLLDFLNLSKSRFLPLETATGQLLVNRRMIERVRALD